MTRSPNFLSMLGEAAVAALFKHWIVRLYTPGELIVAHGESGRDVFFILEGRARVTLFSENGREIFYGDRGPGDIIGEVSAIDGKARSASVVALEATRAARLPAPAFRRLVTDHPDFSWALLEHLSSGIRHMTDRVYEFSTLVVRRRLILELLRRADDRDESTSRVFIDPAPTHFELAASISTHREAVSREMSVLAKGGLIERCGRRLLLCDLTALELLAGDEEEQVFSRREKS
ncbi:cyclic nucleotide-binding domain-containing protein [Sinorhizobium medicae]|nr:cyclic nucleotide-binding domain-containing protein [Sinorhizobium medicae]MDX0790303.1 cyclic nucleotide-binding domain-containing protein [Sinorhizobium medicae]MDX0803134.1 cyclic nucleotide-binding domain-containing protein [Sinorhizobium medicae]